MLPFRRRRKVADDRVTRGLAVIALGTLGVVIGGEFHRRFRRRIAAAHPADHPVEALQAAGRASQDTLIVAYEGYTSASRRETVLFNMLSGFIGALAVARVSTAGIRAGWWPFRNVSIGGRHIHHFVPGIAVAFTSGGAALLTQKPEVETVLAVPFGAGVGLTLDEAALLLDLRDVYWTREGLLSVQVSLGVTSILAAAIILLRMLQSGEERVEQQGLFPAGPDTGETHTDLLGSAGAIA